MGVEWNGKCMLLQSNLELKTKDANRLKSQVTELEQKLIQRTSSPPSSDSIPPSVANTARVAAEEEREEQESRLKLLEVRLFCPVFRTNTEWVLTNTSLVNRKT